MRTNEGGDEIEGKHEDDSEFINEDGNTTYGSWDAKFYNGN